MVRGIHHWPLHIMPVNRILVVGAGMHRLLWGDTKQQQAGKPQRKNDMKYPPDHV